MSLVHIIQNLLVIVIFLHCTTHGATIFHCKYCKTFLLLIACSCRDEYFLLNLVYSRSAKELIVVLTKLFSTFKKSRQKFYLYASYTI